VFVPLAVSELLGCSSREFLKAVVIANEIGGRVGASCFLGPLNGQMWTFIHLAGAAAAASSLLGLDTEKTANAISIALTQPNFSLQPGFFRPSSKLLAASVPAVTGMNAAFFAKNGMTGPADIFESPRGFWRRFSFRPLPEMLEDLGKFWVLDTLTIKTYPGCHYFQTARDALERIFGDRGAARLSGVESITIDTTKLACEVSKLAIEAGVDDSRLTPVSVAFDLRLSAAVLLHGGRIGPAELNTSYLQKNARALRSWAGKISVVHDPSLTFEVIRCARRIESGKAATDSFRLWELPSIARKYREFYGSTLMTAGEVARSIKSLSRGRKDAQNSGQAASGLVFPSRVTVRFADGKTVSERVDLPSGSITRPGMQAELEKKFLRSCMKALGSGRAVKAFRIGLDLENESVSRFVKSTSPKS
jgi:2-methylcitrate dehydratase PrpD